MIKEISEKSLLFKAMACQGDHAAFNVTKNQTKSSPVFS